MFTRIKTIAAEGALSLVAAEGARGMDDLIALPEDIVLRMPCVAISCL